MAIVLAGGAEFSMRVRRPFLLNGQPTTPGQVVNVTAAIAAELITSQKAEPLEVGDLARIAAAGREFQLRLAMQHRGGARIGPAKV